MPEWFIPSVEEFQSERALLHLGLNGALRHYRELVVPGIGGVWFVRQLSWAVAGIALAKKYSLKPAKVANAIEALACKLEWRDDPDNYNKRGQRAFSRDSEDNIWSFSALSDKKNYVQVTYRQSTVRALIGLKLATGTRFNAMELSGTGHNLSEAFLGQKKIYDSLSSWFNGKDINATNAIVEGLVSRATAEEKEIARNILRADSTDILGDPLRRCLLIDAFGRNTVNMPGLHVIQKNLLQSQAKNIQRQVDNIDTSLAFDKMLECGRGIIHLCAQLIAEKTEPFVDKLAKDKRLSDALNSIYKAADEFQATKGNKHPDALKFVAEILAPSTDKAVCLRKVIQRDKNILDLAGEKVIEGHLFDRRREPSNGNDSVQDKAGTEESSTENKIRQLFELWSDCQ